jgi:hypothetical protein
VYFGSLGKLHAKLLIKYIFFDQHDYAYGISLINLSFSKLFEANYDSSTIVRQRLMPVIVTRFIQVRPISWVGKCALRVEFYGFYEGEI